MKRWLQDPCLETLMPAEIQPNLSANNFLIAIVKRLILMH